MRNEENNAAVSASLNDDCQLSIHCRSKKLGLSYSTAWKILPKDLGVKPFNIQLVQELNPDDLPQWRIFGEWAFGKFAGYSFLYQKIVFRDKSNFLLNGYVNKQSCRFWSKNHPEALQKLPMHPENSTVWCDLWAGDIGPYFFQDAANHNVTVNGERYRELICNFFYPKCKSLTCMTCSFNKSMKHATLHA